MLKYYLQDRIKLLDDFITKEEKTLEDYKAQKHWMADEYEKFIIELKAKRYAYNDILELIEKIGENR